MSRLPDPENSTKIDQWWSTLDLRAPLETDLVMSAHREHVGHRHLDESPLGANELLIQRRWFLSRVDDHIAELRGLDCNRSIPYAGRFGSDIRFYTGAANQLERRGLLELRTDKGQNLLIIGDRLRPVGSGCALNDVAFTGEGELPLVSVLMSPAAYFSELSKIARLLKTPVGQEFLDGLSALYCLIRERIAVRHGAEVGWDARIVSFTPHWAGEETSFTVTFEKGGLVSTHLDYVAELCELEIRTYYSK